jgi:hypothetical protein
MRAAKILSLFALALMPCSSRAEDLCANTQMPSETGTKLVFCVDPQGNLIRAKECESDDVDKRGARQVLLYGVDADYGLKLRQQIANCFAKAVIDALAEEEVRAALSALAVEGPVSDQQPQSELGKEVARKVTTIRDAIESRIGSIESRLAAMERVLKQAETAGATPSAKQ